MTNQPNPESMSDEDLLREYAEHSNHLGYHTLTSEEVDAIYAEILRRMRPPVPPDELAEMKASAERLAEWYPDIDPITGLEFFTEIDHPSKGLVPTYGGPFDSYTLTECDSNGAFCRERYDHDKGAWTEFESVALEVVDEGAVESAVEQATFQANQEIDRLLRQLKDADQELREERRGGMWDMGMTLTEGDY